jgi:1-acyl-sn-glycerol-3-phosphate acyltransferase
MKESKTLTVRPPLSPDRAAVQAKIEEYERLGGEYFFCDVEDDPPHPTLEPNDVDYLCRRFKTKCKRAYAHYLRYRLTRFAKRHFAFKVEGAENLEALRDVGAVFTSNHFSPFDSGVVRMASRMTPGRHHFYSVVREGNYFMSGTYGTLLKYCDTLPISSSIHTMGQFNAAVSTLLSRHAHILMYPEQAMWLNYKEPRPLRDGAFHLAAKNGVPVVPCFVTLSECGDYEQNGTPHMHYTLHVMPPIYPDPSKTVRENAVAMRRANEALTRATYERVYGRPSVIACIGEQMTSMPNG